MKSKLSIKLYLGGKLIFRGVPEKLDISRRVNHEYEDIYYFDKVASVMIEMGPNLAKTYEDFIGPMKIYMRSEFNDKYTLLDNFPNSYMASQELRENGRSFITFTGR